MLQQLFDKVTVAAEVKAEFGEPLPDWINVVAVENVEKIKFLKINLDPGEASSIVPLNVTETKCVAEQGI